MTALLQRFLDRLIAWRYPLLLLAAVAAAAAVPVAGGLRFDRSLVTMFPSDDPLLEPYQKAKRIFGGNEAVLAVYVDDELLAPNGQGIERLAGVRRALAAVPGIHYAWSLDQPMGKAVVEEGNPQAQRVRKLLEGYTHGADRRTVAVVCLLSPEAETEVPRSETFRQMRELMQKMPSGMIAGDPVMVADGFRYVEEDGRRLGWATTVLLALVILLCFRSLRWVVVPIFVVQLAVVLTKAALVVSGLTLTMVSSMLTAVVTVIGVGAVVHITMRFREARWAGLPPRDALSRAGMLVAGPIFWSIATDVVGFSSLLLARAEPIQDFGLMMAIGASMVLVAIVLLVPGLVLAGRFDIDPQRAWGEGRLGRHLDRLTGWIERRPLTVAVLALTVAGVCLAGTARLEVETDFTRNFRAGSPIVRSYTYIEAHLGGAGVWDVILPAPRMLDWGFLQRVRSLEQRLRDEVVIRDAGAAARPGLTKVFSLADVVAAGAPLDLDRVPIPAARNALLAVGLADLRRQVPGLVPALYGQDPGEPGKSYLRIALRAREQQPAAEKLETIRQVEQIVRAEFPPDEDSDGGEVSGSFVLLTHLIESILRDQWLAFAVATAGIGLMMVVALRGPVYALVALVPNVLPVLVVTGAMGWLGLKINMGAAMIGAVSIGLSIDSSIHYITSFRRARMAGQTRSQALVTVQQTVGRAVLLSTLALVAGFLVLATSQFVPTIYFGVLVSLTMLGGLAGNLVVLPLLLRYVTYAGREGGGELAEAVDDGGKPHDR